MQTEFRFMTHGGKREGAGRPRTLMSDPPHLVRETHRRSKPVHVTCRCERSVGRLRVGAVRDAVGAAVGRVNVREGFRVVHMSLQQDHVHFIVEAEDHRIFVAGMRALTVATAKAINKAKGRTGRVFAYRFHATYVSSPRQARNVLAYVLNNWRHHLEDEKSVAARGAELDPYASGATFRGWRERVAPPTYEPLVLAAPHTWLLREGWMKHPLISIHETPKL
jgi:REP element-mobilizing transposase RayT|nr:transposase [Kofleriaceae bacterium]